MHVDMFACDWLNALLCKKAEISERRLILPIYSGFLIM